MSKATSFMPVAVACLLGGAALAVSLTHAGPAGTPGPAGPPGRPGDPGRSASSARFGICWDYSTQTSSDGTATWVTSVSLAAPTLVNGVYVCQAGQFVSIVPQPSP